MREYRRRKRMRWASTPASLPPIPSGVRAPEPSRVYPKTIDRSGPQPAPANSALVREAVRSSFKPPLQLARTFSSGSSPHGFARIAITPATVRPAHGAAIVEEERDEGGGHCGVSEFFPISNLPPSLFVSLTCTVPPHTMAARHDR